MNDGYNFKQLKEEILKLSEASDWETARNEWSLVTIYDVDEPDTCLCGHYPIIEICEIANKITKKRADVGNVCVKRFLGVRSDLIFTGVKRIRGDLGKSLNADSIAYFRQKGVLDEWEYNFLQNTMRMRSLTAHQLAKRRQINQKVLSTIQRRGFKGPG